MAYLRIVKRLENEKENSKENCGAMIQINKFIIELSDEVHSWELPRPQDTQTNPSNNKMTFQVNI